MGWLAVVLCAQDPGWACRAWPGQEEGPPFSCYRTTMVEKVLTFLEWLVPGGQGSSLLSPAFLIGWQRELTKTSRSLL